MKKYLFIIMILALGRMSYAQVDTTLLYLRFPVVPSFKLTNIKDSTYFTRENLKKKTPTVIMIFSPDCEHCQFETNAIKSSIELFKKAQIIMVSPLEYPILRKFYDEYKIADYPVITMGRDPGYFLGTFYKVRSFPAIFVYDKKGKFVKAFDGSYPISDIVAALK